jgi:hypothetical protein
LHIRGDSEQQHATAGAPHRTRCRTLAGPKDDSGMLIYLDANLVQYCADHCDFDFGESDTSEQVDSDLGMELSALHRLVELEQFGDWTFAAPKHLLEELRAGKTTEEQKETYKRMLGSNVPKNAGYDAPIVQNTFDTRR